MTGKHSTKSKEPLVVASPIVMPDPDNLHVDLDSLPRTGPVPLSRRESAAPSTPGGGHPSVPEGAATS